MNQKITKSTIVILILVIILAGFLRWTGFKNPHNYTFDETLYAQFGIQLIRNPFHYTSLPVYEYATKRGRPLPDYLKQPLFKHPPLHSYLVSLSYFAFGPSFSSAVLVSIVAGIVMIVVAFLLGFEFFNRYVGLLAAFLVTIDPIHWLCSEKMWMETTMAAFIWLSLYFLIKAIINKSNKFYIWAGFTTGAAILTKYPAFIIFPIGLTFAVIYNRKSFKSKYFWMWPLISFAMFSPWMLWNYKVYGGNFLSQVVTAQGEVRSYFYDYLVAAGLILLAVFGLITYLVSQKKMLLKKISNFVRKYKIALIIISGGLFALFLQPYMLKGLHNMLKFSYVPLAGWKMGMFKNEPWYFYIRRIIELSPFYFIAITGLFYLGNFKSKLAPYFISIFWMMFVFILHRAFQSRYIVSVVPAFMVIASYIIYQAIKKTVAIYKKNNTIAFFIAIVLLIILIYSFAKTFMIDINLALPNKVCYF